MATCSIVRTFNSARSQLRVFVHSLAIQNTANPFRTATTAPKPVLAMRTIRGVPGVHEKGP